MKTYLIILFVLSLIWMFASGPVSAAAGMGALAAFVIMSRHLDFVKAIRFQTGK